MKQEQFDQILKRRVELIVQVLASKAKEYAKGDRLSNFKRSAAFLNITPEKVCLSFWMKHATSIADILDDIDKGIVPTPEMVSEKVGDAINYLVLLEALLVERNAEYERMRVDNPVTESGVQS